VHKTMKHQGAFFHTSIINPAHAN